MTDTTALDTLILEILAEHPDGLSEYELLKALRNTVLADMAGAAQSDRLTLFRMHFLLFNTLYRLRERLWQERRGHLEIDVLRIVLRPYRHGTAALDAYDPLRDYYLDLNNLHDTTDEDVAALLASFWTRMQADGQRAAALAVLELEEPVDYAVIKKRYRTLAMRYHPDRGGDTARLQAINHAMEILEKCYGK